MTAAERLIASVAPQIRAEARAEGVAEGRTEGVAAMLRRQLELEFGPLGADTDARLREASPSELEAWTERILSAASIGDVFGE